MKSKDLITRRNLLIAGVTSVGGLLLSGCSRKLPPTYGNVLRMGDTFTYAVHKALLPGESLVKEYSHRDISSFPATGTTNPGDPNHPRPSEIYRNLERGGFADWRLSIEGLVSRPGSYSMADLKGFPSRTQITRHVCEEGWCAIAEWTGVPLSRVLAAAGMLPTARFVSFYSYDDWADCIDMLDALHPQTILAYGMNGRELSIPHGAPLRLRVEKQLGYKSMKYLQRIVVRDEFDDGGQKGSIQNGWAWYVGI
ncbi:MAG TPA: molybdopterin-dependent oxidoreductase [Pyrinomonadaceae bacterium]|nr:molybdopterin-dependent oxidoreductase [Pyrinomonadaceae bacterium]